MTVLKGGVYTFPGVSRGLNSAGAPMTVVMKGNKAEAIIEMDTMMNPLNLDRNFGTKLKRI